MRNVKTGNRVSGQLQECGWQQCHCVHVCMCACVLCRKKNQKTQLQTLHWWLSAKRSSRSDALTDFATRVKFMDMLRHLINCRFISEHELTFTFAICRRPSVRPSVCLSVCLSSVTFVHPTQAIEIFANIFISYERSFILVFWEEEWLVGGDPFYVKFWVNRPPLQRPRSASAVTPSKKSSINTNRKSTMHFPMSLRWSSYVAPKSPKGGLKNANLLESWPASVKVIYITQDNTDSVCLLFVRWM